MFTWRTRLLVLATTIVVGILMDTVPAVRRVGWEQYIATLTASEVFARLGYWLVFGCVMGFMTERLNRRTPPA